jgi:hypothetical protein
MPWTNSREFQAHGDALFSEGVRGISAASPQT